MDRALLRVARGVLTAAGLALLGVKAEALVAFVGDGDLKLASLRVVGCACKYANGIFAVDRGRLAVRAARNWLQAVVFWQIVPRPPPDPPTAAGEITVGQGASR